jgi:hypothetical protein
MARLESVVKTLHLVIAKGPMDYGLDLDTYNLYYELT